MSGTWSIVSRIRSYHTIVIEAPEEAVQALRYSVSPKALISSSS